jgi:hypothetical protein
MGRPRVGVVTPVVAGVADDAPGVVAAASSATASPTRRGGLETPRRLVPARRARFAAHIHYVVENFRSFGPAPKRVHSPG